MTITQILRHSPLPIFVLLIAATVPAALAEPGAHTNRSGRIVQVDHVPRAGAPVGSASGSSMSATGRFIAFDTSSALVSVDDNSSSDVYVRDMKTNKLWLASRTHRGGAAHGPSEAGLFPGPHSDDSQVAPQLSWDPAITPDGRYVVFTSTADNLVPGDTNLLADIFLFDRKRDEIERVSLTDKDEQTGYSSTRVDPYNLPHSWHPAVDGSAQRIAWVSGATNVVESDDNLARDVFMRDRKSGRTIRISIGPNGEDPAKCEILSQIGIEDPPPVPGICSGAASDHPVLSANGRYVAFDSLASNLIKGDTNGVIDAFVHDLRTKKIERVSVASGGAQVHNGVGFEKDGYSGTASYVCPLCVGPYATNRAISANGRFIAFVSNAPDVIPRDSNGAEDVFVHDRRTNRTERVTLTPWGQGFVAPARSQAPSISADGRFVAFLAYSEQIPGAPQQWPSGSQALVHDRRSGSTEIVSLTNSGQLSDGCRTFTTTFAHTDQLDISSDGRYVSFGSCTSNLRTFSQPKSDALDRGGFHVFRRDRGPVVGSGGLLNNIPKTPQQGPPPNEICIPVVGCFPPPGGVHSVSEGKRGTGEGHLPTSADLIGSRVVYRPQYDDLYVHIDVDRLDSITDANVASLVLYGFRFEANGVNYEVRAQRSPLPAYSAAGGKLGLFRCEPMCREVASIRGGIGTTGDSIAFSVAIHTIGLDQGGWLDEITAFSSRGTFEAGEVQLLDKIWLD